MVRRRRRRRTRLETPQSSRVRLQLARAPLRVITWESEVCTIVEETTRWTVETGGDLFGFWDTTPTIFLATRAGPQSVREHTHFRLDVDYVRKLGELLGTDWGLRYFGDWHSHHRLGLKEPSSGDRQRIGRLAGRNAFREMLEVIVTFEPNEPEQEPTVSLHPWAYSLADGRTEPATALLDVTPGISPIREALVARGVLPEQELGNWTGVPVTRIRIGGALDPLVPSGTTVVDSVIEVRALAHAVTALAEVSGAPVERHDLPFGWILAVPIDEGRFVGIAVDGTWPHRVLEIDSIDRRQQTSTPLALELPFSILAPDGLTTLYERARELVEGKGAPI